MTRNQDLMDSVEGDTFNKRETLTNRSPNQNRVHFMERTESAASLWRDDRRERSKLVNIRLGRKQSKEDLRKNIKGSSKIRRTSSK